MEFSIPHYRAVTKKDICDLALTYLSGMMPCGDDMYNYPLATWTDHDALRIISQARDIMGWSIRFMNGKFYHVDWILPKKKEK